MPRGLWVWLSRAEAWEVKRLLGYHLDSVNARYAVIVRRIIGRVGRAEKRAERGRRKP